MQKYYFFTVVANILLLFFVKPTVIIARTGVMADLG